ncbi:neutral alpha-glucosidase ab [Plectosphaerella plurivora]|uniref:alpha-glucosidase n=1 Tax=Plectosphaerella plurivora TaxID=936078 RepID=A0A9P8V5H9_9PEZI|nr:neutral alpha-glucosidase ab [Plectosphaerella plurivora]
MPQNELIPSGWAIASSAEDAPSIHLTSSSDGAAFNFTFEAVRPNIFRTTYTSDSHPVPPRPSVPRAEVRLGDAKPSVTSSDKSKTIKFGDVFATVEYSGETPHLSAGFVGQETPLLQDVPNRSYTVDGPGVAHYTRYNRNTLHVGLGEKAAPMNLSGRRFQLSATDSFGYDVHRTDPLYKNIPLLINATQHGCVATFSTTHTRGEYSVGSEMDGMWGFYKVYRQDFGGLEEYTIIGKTLKDVVIAYAELAGFPLLVPRWAFGYLSGGMKYSMLDDPPASESLLDLARKMKLHDIPCSAYQMSSGYTVAEKPPKTRNVFTWNRHRFPDPEGWIKEYHSMGMRLIANVKPYLINSHPEYQKLKAAGGLFTDPRTGKPAVTKLWSAGGGESDDGGHIDFTSEAGYNWWYNGVKELASQGIDCMWNDNNEYTVTSDDWECALDQASLDVPAGLEKRPQIGLWGRSLHTELHAKASHDALLEVNPDERPFVLTRSATAGTMRYACSTWSGDNTTSWPGMKGANALSLNAGLSLMHCYGHDIGGFEGPQPSPELLLRWVQLGIYSPRFAINCFKTGTDNSVGDVIEPWMYPSITHLVRKTIKRRYALIPYIYSLMLDSHRTATPPQRWTGWGYEADSEVWTSSVLTDGETQYFLGDTLLIGGVYEPGVSKARVYLPKASEDDEGFVNTNAPYEYYAAGQWVDIGAEWHGAGIAVLAKVGGAIAVGRDVQVLSPGEKANVANLPLDDYRAVEIFPPQGASKGGKWHETTWHEDDGVAVVTKNRVSSYTIGYTATEEEVRVKFARDESSGFEAPWKSLVVVLPSGDLRKVVKEDGGEIKALGVDEQGRHRFEVL